MKIYKICPNYSYKTSPTTDLPNMTINLSNTNPKQRTQFYTHTNGTFDIKITKFIDIKLFQQNVPNIFHINTN